MHFTGRSAFGALSDLSLVMLMVGLSGCGGVDSLPLAPSPPPPQAAGSPVPIDTWMSGYTLTGVSLSGTVYESTADGPTPIAGAGVYCELCGALTHTWTKADANGFYSFPGNLADGGGIWLSVGNLVTVMVQADGYHDPNDRLGQRDVLIIGDTRADFELVKR